MTVCTSGATGRTARSIRSNSDREDEVDLPHTGTITNFVVVTPVQYPGQTETEPFANVFVLLDGFDVVMAYQPVVELPVGDLRVGMRVGAVLGFAG